MKKIIFTAIALLCISIISFAQIKVITPEIEAPDNEADNQMPDVFLDWSAITNATGYHVMLGSDENFTNIVKDTITQYGAYQCIKLMFNSTYYWKVRAIENEEYSEWTEIRSFTTFEKLLLNVPTDGSENKPVELLLKWKNKFTPAGDEVSGFNYYQLQIDTVAFSENPFFNPDHLLFELPVWDEFIEIGNIQYNLINAYYGSTFHWRIRALHDQDTSAWSETWTFSTNDIITLLLPNNTIEDQGVSLRMEWTRFVGTEEYVCQLNTDPNFLISETFFTDSTKVSRNNLIYGNKYYWRVLGRHARDTSDWSEIWEFTTAGAVTLNTPVNGADSVSINPDLGWKQIKGSSQYQVQYGVDETFAATNNLFIPSIDSIANPIFRILSDLEYNTQYFWRIRGLTSVDTSDYSEVWSFTTMDQVGIDEYFNKENVTIFPNPASKKAVLHIDAIEPGNANYTLIDLTGQEIQSHIIYLNSGINNISLELDGMAKGIYLVNIKNDNQFYTIKLIIK